MRIQLIILLFLLIGAFFIITNNNIHINKQNEMNLFYKTYYGWFANLFDNVKSLTGYVINAEWLPDMKYNITTENIDTWENKTTNSTIP